MPCKVLSVDGGSIAHVYGPDDTEPRTVRDIEGTTRTTDYCGNVVYENDSPKLLLTEEGYVTLPDRRYHYYLKDHQGNNRVVIGEDGTVEEVSHYYPFGGLFAGTGSVQPYKYNGKELESDAGFDWYDYGARRYDAALERFASVEPLAEMRMFFSVYAYASDNPVNKVYVNGMLDDRVEDKDKDIYWEPNDISHFTGYTTSPDAQVYGAVDEGLCYGHYIDGASVCGIVGIVTDDTIRKDVW